MPFADRDSFIALLDKLGSEDDAEVLAAAREIRARMADGGMTWNDLLRPAPGTEPEEDFVDDWDGETDLGDDEPDEGIAALTEGDSEGPASDLKSDAALIRSLLERKTLSQVTREELEGYRGDIKEGNFTQADSRYLRALAARLDKQPSKPRKGAKPVAVAQDTAADDDAEPETDTPPAKD